MPAITPPLPTLPHPRRRRRCRPPPPTAAACSHPTPTHWRAVLLVFTWHSEVSAVASPQGLFWASTGTQVLAWRHSAVPPPRQSSRTSKCGLLKDVLPTPKWFQDPEVWRQHLEGTWKRHWTASQGSSAQQPPKLMRHGGKLCHIREPQFLPATRRS